MNLDNVSIVLLMPDASTTSAAFAWISSLDSFQIGASAFLVRGRGYDALVCGMESRLSQKGSYFVSTFRYADAAATGGAPPVAPAYIELLRWLEMK